ncbi:MULTISPECIES: FAD-binding protein [unclassified Nocardioides]|uniref:FAD-binding protein n=1 Tax=unclassified Nocardioides TaxID=2615069 RepID=UPI001F3183ED|nr:MULTISPECIES: FAD-binding protein [unclassified Nocardioides]
MEKNWAGNHTYVAEQVQHPASVDELREVVARHDRVRALGTRHAFTDLADTTGVLVGTAGLGRDVEIDEDRRVVRVSGGVRYGDLAEQLAHQDWALATMASLPHISVAGAVATGTHGSGDRTGSLAAAVAGLEIVGADGELRTISRGDEDFDGHVVSLGALGVVTHVTLDVELAYDVRQDLFTDLPWDLAVEHLDDLTASAYSVSLFTDWVSGTVQQVWLKSRGAEPPAALAGAVPATGTLHMLAGADIAAVTEQGGAPGPWHQRLPHFRMEFTPSRGEELQSEYLVPRSAAPVAIERLRALAPAYAALLQVSEVRTIAADRLWLSGAYDADAVGFHFTWLRDVPGVYGVLPAIEEALLPLGGRPHWGKCFAAGADALRPLYPRFDDFRELAARRDPTGKFRNAFLTRTVDLRCDLP